MTLTPLQLRSLLKVAAEESKTGRKREQSAVDLTRQFCQEFVPIDDNGVTFAWWDHDQPPMAAFNKQVSRLHKSRVLKTEVISARLRTHMFAGLSKAKGGRSLLGLCESAVSRDATDKALETAIVAVSGAFVKYIADRLQTM